MSFQESLGFSRAEYVNFLDTFFDGRYCVENVVPYYEPLIQGQMRGRHIFWSNFYIPEIDVEPPEKFARNTTKEGKEMLEEWLEIHLEQQLYVKDGHDPCQILRNCVHPKIGEAVLEAARKKEQKSLGKFV